MEVDDNSDTTGWFDMPFEMRKIIINYMDLATKIQFSQCSKLCFEEVQLPDSRYFSVSISNSPCSELEGVFFEVLSDHIWISDSEDEDGDGDGVVDDEDKDEDESDVDREIEWMRLRPTFLVCDNPNISEEELMELRSEYDFELIEVETREKVTDYVMYLLRGLLKFLKNCFRSLTISIPDFPYNKMKIERNLKYLESIDLSPNDKVDPISCGFIDFEHLCSLRKIVEIPNLTFDQIFQLKAGFISVGYDGSEKFDIIQFVNRLFTDGIDRNVQQITFEAKQDLNSFPEIHAIPGIYATRSTPWSDVEYLFKRGNKMFSLADARQNSSVTIYFHNSIDSEHIKWIRL
ncbi:unnamed protein product [Caenorhabditis angaria]|uniref:F-box domain-containing protein n=1 Tax=Caenorhabditis angaria TaxID=860376 RepID=A0A9P1MV22_9PELO|nr:unnamed protein product [Caenorhabditis angaria]